MGVIKSTRRMSNNVRSFKDAAKAKNSLRPPSKALGGMARFEAEKAERPPLDGRSLVARLVVVILVMALSAAAFYTPSSIAWLISVVVNAVIGSVVFLFQLVTPAEFGFGFQFDFPIPLATPLALALGFLAMQIVTRSVARQRNQRSTGSRAHYWKKLGRLTAVQCVALLGVTAVVIQLLGTGLPSSFGGGLLPLLAQWCFGVSLLAGLGVAYFEGVDLGESNHEEEQKMNTWGAKDGYFQVILGRWVDTPEFHEGVHFEGDVVRLHPVPSTLIRRLHDIEITIAKNQNLDHIMLDPTSTPTDLRWSSASDDWVERRTMLRNTDYALLRKYDIGLEDEEILGSALSLPEDAVSPDASSPAKPVAALLADGVSEKHMPQIQRFARDSGMTVVGYDFERYNSVKQRYENLVYLQEVNDVWTQTIKRGSDLLGIKPGTLWMEPHWVDNDEDDRDEHALRIDTVVIKRSPVSGLTPEARDKYYSALVGIMPKGSNGWTIEDDQGTGIVVLRYGKPRELPEVVSMSDLLPVCLDPGNWSNIALGLDERGEVTGPNLKDGPHTLVVGPTGSGKTIALRQIAVSALARGHDVVLIDQIKGAVDFIRIQHWFKAVAVTFHGASDAMVKVYEEVVRRKQVLIRNGEGFWEDISPEVRETENIRPLTVMIDEFASLVLQVDIPKGADKSSPAIIEAMEINEAKANILMYAAKLAREARFVGVHLAIALQRPDASIISGEFRSNLTSGVLLVKPGSLPRPEILGMVFPGASEEAAQTVNALDNGSKGLALVAAEGGAVKGVKVGFVPGAEIPAILEGLGVPKPTQWKFGEDDPGPSPLPSGPVSPPALPLSTEPSEEDLDELAKLLRE